jgi:hypothetical protein
MASTTKKTSSTPSKATASKATASKATATKSAAKSHISHTVTFTQTPEDQELLEAIAEELADQTFESFEQVCKEALRYFLFEDDVEEIAAIEEEERAEGTAPDSSQGAAQYLEQHLGQVIQRLEQMEAVVSQPLTLLQKQVTSLENTLAQKDGQHLTELAVQLDRLGQQVDRLEAMPEASSSEALLMDALPSVDASGASDADEASVESETASESITEPGPAAPSPSQKTLDPRLSLLSALLEDF